jgi:hypothetical protein
LREYGQPRRKEKEKRASQQHDYILPERWNYCTAPDGNFPSPSLFLDPWQYSERSVGIK